MANRFYSITPSINPPEFRLRSNIPEYSLKDTLAVHDIFI